MGARKGRAPRIPPCRLPRVDSAAASAAAIAASRTRAYRQFGRWTLRRTVHTGRQATWRGRAGKSARTRLIPGRGPASAPPEPHCPRPGWRSKGPPGPPSRQLRRPPRTAGETTPQPGAGTRFHPAVDTPHARRLLPQQVHSTVLQAYETYQTMNLQTSASPDRTMPRPEASACAVRHDPGHAVRSPGSRELRQPKTKTDYKPVTESNLTHIESARVAAVIWSPIFDVFGVNVAGPELRRGHVTWTLFTPRTGTKPLVGAAFRGLWARAERFARTCKRHRPSGQP